MKYVERESLSRMWIDAVSGQSPTDNLANTHKKRTKRTSTVGTRHLLHLGQLFR